MAAPTSAPRLGYSSLQILLHWVVVILVLFQLIFGEAMEEALDAFEEGEPLADMTGANLHLYAGILILVLAALRLVIRFTQGVPPPPAGTSAVQALAAGALHAAFYVLLFAAPVSGLVAWYVNPEVGDIHTLVKPAFIVLIVLHVAAALYHQYVAKDGGLMRILVPKT